MSMIKRYAVLLAAMFPALLAPHFAVAEPVGTFTRIEGSVDVLRQTETAAVPVQTGDPVSKGDAVRTKGDGKAEITFRDATSIRLAPETRITIDEYSYQGDSVRVLGLINLLRGRVRAVVAKVKTAVMPLSLTNGNFSMKTPTAVAGVRGTDFIVYYEQGITGVIFIEGEGFLYNPLRPDWVVNVNAGQSSFVMGENEIPLDVQPPAAPAPLITGEMPVEPPGGVSTLVPITQAYPELLPTPVHLTITIP